MSTPEQPSDTQGQTTEPKVDWEKRYKDTQASLTRTSQELSITKAKLTATEALVKPTVTLSDEKKAELDDLKYSDPDKWREEMNGIEQTALKETRQSIDGATEMARRQQVFADFTAANPDIVLTDEVIKYDIPGRISSKLEKGEISFEEFLQEAANYLKAPKSIKTEQVLDQPNLGKAGGDGSPLDTSGAEKQTPYSQTLF